MYNSDKYLSDGEPSFSPIKGKIHISFVLPITRRYPVGTLEKDVLPFKMGIERLHHVGLRAIALQQNPRPFRLQGLRGDIVPTLHRDDPQLLRDLLNHLLLAMEVGQMVRR